MAVEVLCEEECKAATTQSVRLLSLTAPLSAELNILYHLNM